MSVRRLIVIAASVLAALLLAIVLYLTFGDLGRHKSQIEGFLTRETGRPFTIEGAFKLKVLPSISVVAEEIHFANAKWGSQPSMVEIGRFATQVSLWSLISGPVLIRSLKLRDVSVVLEKSPDGESNWVLDNRREAENEADSGVTGLPVVIEDGRLSNARVTYREPGKTDRVAVIETLSMGLGKAGLLAISGKGRLNDYATTLTGEAGPIEALLSGRDIHMAIKASVGNLQLAVDGGFGRLDPLEGAALTLKMENPDLGTMLKNLQLPVVATGALKVDGRLSDAGNRTRVELDATLGDIKAKANGTLRTLGLAGSDLQFDVAAADAARLAAVFDVTGVPRGVLKVGGHVSSASAEELRLDGVTATLAGAKARADGTIRVSGDPGATIRFDVTAESLARLRKGLPEMPFKASGTFAGGRDRMELTGLQSRVGDTDISGNASVLLTGKRRFDIALTSPRVDLTPFMAKEKDSSEAKATSGDAAGTTPAEAKGEKPTEPASEEPAPKKKFVFSETPLPLDKLKAADGLLSLRLAEVKLGAEVLKDVEGRLKLDKGDLQLDVRAADTLEGTLNGSVRLKPSGDGADLTLNIDAKDLRSGFMAGETVERSQVPATNVKADVRATGASARQMAAGASGQVLVTQARGQVKSGAVDTFGSDLLTQLGGSLNPFAAKDPYTELECTVARIDIVDGQAKIEPVLMQSTKVTVVAQGEVDLHTEKLTFDFNTRPRKGIGITAGMFTNPFIQLGGTLANPKVTTGAKGVASGALAVMTGGLSILAKGAADRVAGEAELCDVTLAKAKGVAPPADEAAENVPEPH